ncbi:N-carbamoyl-L-amino-acid hydrolase [Acinetobacter proteolyticus]|jgi:N-carbamoyl-L-amino-acid hydrolase|uniref:N-carbamoyl-L-amino-acid hydrolase n=1 Tax=Acinetobacter proteolyticus TaxID=1776741 RepID=A0A653K242_9GAMM|nr:Zn-dependent hydrolase [Acinetobacter proteolyticus]VXA54321.1 N-carbamoyl-L-amino-acid hydrolase [Acinetobacter proteolyticus]
MRVNAERLWQMLMEMAKIGATDQGGNTRLALSDEDIAGRALLLEWAEKINLSVHYDEVGNLILRRAGRNESALPIVMGSHLDTQPKGGRFDGIYGVLAGMEVLQRLAEEKISTEHPLELVVWMNEEGARFTPAMMGSAAFAGVIPKQQIYDSTDKQGVSVFAELVRTGQLGNYPLARPFQAYYEAHIEQGPVLEKNEISIGVVTGGQAILWLDVETKGRAAHAGTTPMNLRKDTMVGTAEMIVALEQCILEQFPEGLVTFGEMQVANSSRNTIPGQIQWTIDLRNPDDAQLKAMEQATHQLLHSLAAQRDLEISISQHWLSPATYFDRACVATVQDAVDSLGYSNQTIVSGAGHDAINIAKHCPTTMIFIPCINGLSHNEAEDIYANDAAQGADVLLNAILNYDRNYAAQDSSAHAATI